MRIPTVTRKHIGRRFRGISRNGRIHVESSLSFSSRRDTSTTEVPALTPSEVTREFRQEAWGNVDAHVCNDAPGTKIFERH